MMTSVLLALELDPDVVVIQELVDLVLTAPLEVAFASLRGDAAAGELDVRLDVQLANASRYLVMLLSCASADLRKRALVSLIDTMEELSSKTDDTLGLRLLCDFLLSPDIFFVVVVCNAIVDEVRRRAVPCRCGGGVSVAGVCAASYATTAAYACCGVLLNGVHDRSSRATDATWFAHVWRCLVRGRLPSWLRTRCSCRCCSIRLSGAWCTASWISLSRPPATSWARSRVCGRYCAA